MPVHLTRKMKVLFWVLLPFTLGIGTLVMWLRLRRYPERLDSAGITLRSGQRIWWSDIRRVGVLRSHTTRSFAVD